MLKSFVERFLPQRNSRPSHPALTHRASHKLGPETICSRFFGQKAKVSDAELRRITDVDFRRDAAFLVTLGSGDQEMVIGGVSYFALCGGAPPQSGELAFTVVEGHRGRGVAHLLMQHIAGIARDDGLPFLEADVLADNHLMLAVFQHSGLPPTLRRDADMVHVTLALRPEGRQLRTLAPSEAALSIDDGDLVFVDPQYSGVHYRRFYHVLETIARGGRGAVTGVGRNPPAEERPRSKYSMKGNAIDALDDLLSIIARRDGRAIVTFPNHECSGGLSGDIVRELCSEYFRIRVKEVDSRFSTLGGRMLVAGGTGRGGRQNRIELILVLDPR